MPLCFRWKGLYDYTNASNEIVHMGKLSSATKEISKCWVVPIRMIDSEYFFWLSHKLSHVASSFYVSMPGSSELRLHSICLGKTMIANP